MKNTFFIILFSFSVISFISCEKSGCTDKNASNYNINAKKDDGSCFISPDYRSSYVGQYSFEYYYSFTVLGNPSTTTYDTVVYNGAIMIGIDSTINIDWPNSTPRSFRIDNHGVVTKCGKTVGEIKNDSLYIEFDDDLCTPGPLGANSLTQLYGDKY